MPRTSSPATRWWSSDNLTTHVSRAMAELIAARDWLTACQLPPYAIGAALEANGYGHLTSVDSPRWRWRDPTAQEVLDDAGLARTCSARTKIKVTLKVT